MIKKPTLFVLGAGSSHPYGLPLGVDLREMICGTEVESNIRNIYVPQPGSYSYENLQAVARTFRRSSENSIDSFLSRNTHMVEMGKLLIALFICSRENPDSITYCKNTDHWYRLLWNKLIDGTEHGPDLRENKVRFITFNYDRSLEFFLHQSTKGTFSTNNDTTAYEYWSNMKVMHVYGSVGEFNFSSEAARKRSRLYSTLSGTDNLDVAASGINIIPESRADAEEFQTARQWFDWAEHVYILGFGFDRLNCERLGFGDVLRTKLKIGKKFPSIHASVLGLTSAEVAQAQRYLLDDMGIWDAHNATNTMTLRSTGFPN